MHKRTLNSLIGLSTTYKVVLESKYYKVYQNSTMIESGIIVEREDSTPDYVRRAINLNTLSIYDRELDDKYSYRVDSGKNTSNEPKKRRSKKIDSL